MAIEVAQVVAQFGAYYKPGSDNQKNLRSMLYKPSETAKYFSTRPTEDTIWRGNLSSLNRVVQPFQKAYTPIGTTTFVPNLFPLFKLKVDLLETPDDLEPSYLGFLTNVEEVERAKWPFVRWWMDQHVHTRMEEDFETAEYFKGVYAAPVAGIAGDAGTSMDGLRKVIRGYNTAGRTNLGNGAIAMGAPAASDADFCTQIEEWFAQIPSQFRDKIDFIFMSKDNRYKYRRGKRAKYGKEFNFVTDQGVSGLVILEDFPQVSIVGLESHQGSDLIWCSVPLNRIRPQKKASLANSMLVKEFSPRVVSAYTDFWEALNFEVPEFVFHNDQDLA